MQFYFQMPSSGILIVVATLQACELYCGGNKNNELGFSSGTIWQSAGFSMWLPPPTERFIGHALIYEKRVDNEDETWDVPLTQPGEIKEVDALLGSGVVLSQFCT